MTSHGKGLLVHEWRRRPFFVSIDLVLVEVGSRVIPADPLVPNRE